MPSTPRLPTAPSPTAFAKARVSAAASPLRDAAGKDGRVTLTTGRRMGERDDFGRLIADDVVRIISEHGQKSMSVDKLLSRLHAEAVASGTVAAGTDSRISYVDAATRLLPTLKDEYLSLRGKDVGLPPARTLAQLKRDVTDVVLRGLDNSTARKLMGLPPDVRGREPLVENIPHPATRTRATAYSVDGQLYVSRASQEPSPLVGWWHVGPLPAPGSEGAQLRTDLETLTRGVWNTSARDAKVKFVVAESTPSEPLEVATVRAKFANAHDLLAKDIYDAQNGAQVAPLASRPARVMDAYHFLARRSVPADPADPDSIIRARYWKGLSDGLKENLSGLKLFRFGEVQVSYLLIGRTRQGDLAGIFTAAVET